MIYLDFRYNLGRAYYWVFFVLCCSSLHSVNWTATLSGEDWSQALNWDGAVPNAQSAIATFPDTAASGAFSVIVDTPITVGTLSVTATADPDYSINGASALTFDNGGTATLTPSSKDSSTTSWSVPMVLTDTVNVTISSSSSIVTLAGDISGSGGFNIDTGAGSGSELRFSGTNTFSGALNIQGGTIGVDSSSSIPSGVEVTVGEFDSVTLKLADGVDFSEDITDENGNGLEFQVEEGDAATFSGVLTGENIDKLGGGTLTLSGANDYASGTSIQEGIVVADNNNSFGLADNTNDIDMANGTRIIINDGITIGNQINLTGTCTIEVGMSATGTLSNNIQSTGKLVKAGAGTLVLSDDNTFTGGFDFDAGSITASGPLGTGDFTFDGGTRLDLSTLEYSTPVIFTQSGTIGVASGQTAHFSESMTFTSAMTKDGDGTLRLDADGDGAGGVILSAGTIYLGDNSVALGTGALSMASGTTLSINASGIVANNISLTGSCTIEAVDSGGDQELSGVLSGTGSLIKTGTEQLILSGTNTYEGATTVSEGTLSVTGSIAQTSGVAVSSGAVLDFTQGSDIVFSPVISGDGSLTKAGAGVLTLSGTNTYSGGTTLSAGTISISDDAGLGSGSIAMSDGTTLVFGSGISASNNATIAGTSTLNVASGTGTLSGIISSTGALTKTGAGTLALSGTNTYTGATTVSEGTLSVVGSIESSSGIAVASGAILNFAPAAASSVESKVISGDGSVTKTGANSQTLSGTNTYTGTTTVSAGTLVVTGTIASGAGDVTVASGATLKGTGSLPATVIQDGGKLDPGTSIGTITVDSLEIESDGTLEIEISPIATSLVNVTNTATINSGATLEILPQAGVYIEGTEHIFLSANSIVGTFAEEDITFDLTELEGEIAVTSIEIVGNDYIIFLQGALQSATSANTAPLQGDAASVYLTSDLVTRINRTQMGLISEVQDQRFLQRQLCCNSVCDNEKDQNEEETAEEFETDTCQDSGDISTYLIVDYSRANIRKRQYMIAGKSYLKSALGGCDIYLTEEFVMGGCFGYVNGDTSSQESGLSHVRSNSFNIGTYFQGRAKGNFFVDGALNIGKNYFESKRSINQFEKGTYHGFDMASQLRILYQSYCAKVNYRPYISTTYYLQKTGNYTEREQTPNQLKVGKDRFDFFELEGGIAFWAPFKIRSWEVVPQLSFSYTRTYLKKPHDVNATFVSSYNGNETQRIANVTDKQWKIDGGISAHSGSCTEFFINYEAVFDNGYSNYQQYRAGVQTSF